MFGGLARLGRLSLKSRLDSWCPEEEAGCCMNRQIVNWEPPENLSGRKLRAKAVIGASAVHRRGSYCGVLVHTTLPLFGSEPYLVAESRTLTLRPQTHVDRQPRLFPRKSVQSHQLVTALYQMWERSPGNPKNDVSSSPLPRGNSDTSAGAGAKHIGYQ